MRIAIASIVFMVSVAVFAGAQPPTAPPESGKFAIRPGGKGAVPVGDKEPDEKPGFVIIRPNGKGITTSQVTEPKQPVLVAKSPAGMLSVPAPGPQPKDVKDGKPIFDYWFAVGVEGQRVGYVNWAAKETQQKDQSRKMGLSVNGPGAPLSRRSWIAWRSVIQ